MGEFIPRRIHFSYSVDWRDFWLTSGVEQRQWPRKRNPQAIQQS